MPPAAWVAWYSPISNCESSPATRRGLEAAMSDELHDDTERLVEQSEQLKQRAEQVHERAEQLRNPHD
jgi:hypothetical protein